MNYHERALEALSRYSDASFDWGSLDCCLFAANIVQEASGVDYAAPWRGQYESKVGALRVIAENGGSLRSLLSSVLGDPVPRLRARRGDPVLAEGIPQLEDGDGVGICTGDRVAFLTDRGLVLVPLADCAVAWHIEGASRE